MVTGHISEVSLFVSSDQVLTVPSVLSTSLILGPCQRPTSTQICMEVGVHPIQFIPLLPIV